MGADIAQPTIRIITLLHLFFYAHVRCETVTEQDILEESCTGNTCQNEEVIKEEKMKYYMEKAKEYHTAHMGGIDGTDEMTEEDLKAILHGFRDKKIDIGNINNGIKYTNSDTESANVDTDNSNRESENSNEVKTSDTSDSDEKKTDSIHTSDETVVDETQSAFEFPKLKVVDPGNVGDVIDLELEDGKVHKMITRSMRPPVFEIPNFLTDEECDYIIEIAERNGLNMSHLFGSDVEKEFEDDLDLSEISRVSEQTWLREENLGTEFWGILQQRLTKLTKLPQGLIKRGEPIQVVSYRAGGHYHAHIDTVDNADHLPCCFQTRCGDKEFTPAWAECCRICRFATVLYYLNEPEEGGETAFPLADLSDELVEEKFVNLGEQEWYNLSHYCHNSSLAVTPKRGTAIFWYNHFVDEQTGYLGKVDRRSHHGGCDLKKGSKWIANNWIAGTPFDDRFKPSIFYNEG